MATLTPLAKGLLTLAILGGAGAAAWHLGGKELLQSKTGSATETTVRSGEADTGGDRGEGSGDDTRTASIGNASTPAKARNGSVGSRSNPLKVSLVSFHGYAPALLANGSSLATKGGSLYAQQGLEVEFVIQDDIPTLTTLFESGTAECAWRTSDFWAQEQPNLRNAGHDARAVLVVDNTQGGDAIIAKDPAVQRVEDLAGKQVALLQFTPSHGMTIDALENSSLTARRRDSVRYVFINAEEGTGGVRAAFESGNVDAAVLWDPDLALALKAVPGAHVVYSTKTATNLIFDVMVCDQRVLATSEGAAAVQKFVAGWLQGVEAARKNPDQAVDALVKTEPLFEQLAKREGRGFVKSLFANVVWTGLDDNARILGLAGGTNHYERVYRRFDAIYRGAGALANPKSPVVNPADSFDYRFVKTLLAGNAAATESAKKPEFEFTEQERTTAVQAAPAQVTKPVTVTFASGASALNKRALKTIDEEMVPFIENNGSAYFEVSGNTDSTGARDINLRLSKARAQAVVDYLVREWDFPVARFQVSGFGPDRPLCREGSEASEGLSLEDCRALNRSTRVAVLTR